MWSNRDDVSLQNVRQGPECGEGGKKEREKEKALCNMFNASFQDFHVKHRFDSRNLKPLLHTRYILSVWMPFYTYGQHKVQRNM